MLDEVNILIVEDEALIALDLSMTVEDHGAAVVGPCTSIEHAMEYSPKADIAILDVDLNGSLVFPVADALRAKGTPFLFHTGRHDLQALRARYGEDVDILEKPADPTALVATVRRLLN